MAYAGPRRLQQLLDAIQAIGAGLDLDRTLERITEVAAELLDARYGALGVLDTDGARIQEFITVGLDKEVRRMIGHPPQGLGLLGAVIQDAKPIRAPDLNEHPDSYGFPANHPPMHSFIGVPIVVGDKVFGNLYLTDKRGDEVFSDVDEEILVGLAAAAGIAIENARLHEQAASVVLVEDRERIARDLHDTVIQRLFAAGLSLQATPALMSSDPTKAVGRIEAVIDDLDATVRQIRTAIFELEVARPSQVGVRSRVLALCRKAAESLGFEPRVTFDGPIDTVTDEQSSADVVATLEEALSNVARHANATEVHVTVLAADGELTLMVADDGVGPRDADERIDGNGLRNIAQRAERHRGRFALKTRAPAGALFTWAIRLDDDGTA